MKQKDLAQVLVRELHAMGVEDAEMDEWGYVFATLPSNTKKQNVPHFAFAHTWIQRQIVQVKM